MQAPQQISGHIEGSSHAFVDAGWRQWFFLPFMGIFYILGETSSFSLILRTLKLFLSALVDHPELDPEFAYFFSREV